MVASTSGMHKMLWRPIVCPPLISRFGKDNDDKYFIGIDKTTKWSKNPCVNKLAKTCCRTLKSTFLNQYMMPDLFKMKFKLSN